VTWKEIDASNKNKNTACEEKLIDKIKSCGYAMPYIVVRVIHKFK